VVIGLVATAPMKKAVDHPMLTARTLLRVPAASAVVQGRNGAWVTDDLSDQLIKFDPTTGHTGTSVNVSGRPVALLLVGAHLWVANMVRNNLEEFVASTLHKVRTVAIPAGPVGMVLLNGRIWVASLEANEVTPVNDQSGTVGQPIAVAGGAVRIAGGFGALWVTGSTDALTEIRPGAGDAHPQVNALTVGTGPIGVTTGDGAVWVANAAGGTVVQVDPTTRRIRHTYGVGGDPLTIAVAGGRVWVGDGSAEKVSIIYPSAAAASVALKVSPRSLLPVGSGVWVAAANPGSVLSLRAG
jgi:hypothetical protein